MSKTSLSLTSIVVILAALLWQVPPAHAATWTVGAGCGPSIQACIDAASTGDTVVVPAGTYNESITINKRLTVQGAGSSAGGTVLQSSASAPTVVGSTYSYRPVVVVAASGVDAANPVLLQDLQVRPRQDILGTAQLPAVLIQPNSTVSYLKLQNVRMVGTNSAGTSENGLTVDASSSLLHLAVDGCFFGDMAYGLVFYNATGLGTTVQYLTMSNTVIDDNAIKGFYAEKLSDATFANVTVTDNGDVSLSPSWAIPWNAGIDVNLKYGTYANLAFNNVSFSGNGVGSANGAGLTVKARGTGNDPSYAANPATLTGVTVTGGTYGGNTFGLRFGEPAKGNLYPSSVVVHQVNIVGNTFGLSNEAVPQVNAESNWWGAASGPTHAANPAGTGDSVSNNVDHDPWLTSAYPPQAHVSAITGQFLLTRTGIQLKAYVHVVDDGDAPVPGAMVNANLTVPGKGILPKTAVTDSSGRAYFTDTARTRGTWQLCVTGISHPDFDWDGVPSCQTWNY